MLQRPDIVLSASIFLLLCVSVLAGYSWLELWSQVRDWWVSDWDRFGWSYPAPVFGAPAPDVQTGEIKTGSTDHTHFLRRMATFPFFWLGLQTGIDPHVVYTAALPLFAGVTVWFTAHTIRGQTGTPLTVLSAIMILPLGLLFLQMHGRIPMALTGYALVLWAIMQRGNPTALVPLAAAALGLLLTGVSSGTLLTALCVYGVLAAYRVTRDGRIAPLVAAAILISGYAYPAYSAILKNLNYYGGGAEAVVGIFRHGLGAMFIPEGTSPWLVFALIGAGVVALALLWIVLQRMTYPLPVLATLVNLAFSTFGLTILVLAIVPATITVAVYGEWARSRWQSTRPA